MKTTGFFLLLILSLNAANAQLKIEVDFSVQPRPFEHFWKSTGFTPAGLLFKKEMQDYIALTGNAANSPILYNRPHSLLYLISASGFETGKPVYNWTRLDSALDIIIRNKQRIFFELMGAPTPAPLPGSIILTEPTKNRDFFTSYFNDMENDQQIKGWKMFVRDLALHLINRYGTEQVRTWYFETFNEPDIPHWWSFNFSIRGFMNYYDACSEGLKEADPQLRFGGPGTAVDFRAPFKELLAHCDTGRNYFTGERGVRIDFISVHVKDMPFDMIRREDSLIQYIRTTHPRLKDVPFVNDEADPVIGWHRQLWWRPTAWYAAFICQSTDLHERLLINKKKVNYALLSNDNGFTGNWGNRTLLASLINKMDTTQVFLVPKPVFRAMELMAMLGHKRYEVTIPDSLEPFTGIIATLRKDGNWAVLLYNKTAIETDYKERNVPAPSEQELQAMKNQSVNLQLGLHGLKASKISALRIDETHANPYAEWVRLGKPAAIDEPVYRNLLNHSEIKAEEIPFNTSDDKIKITVDLPSPAVVLLIIEP